MRKARLMRTWYKTDAQVEVPVLNLNAADPDEEAERYANAVEDWHNQNVGTFSDPFPAPDANRQIVAVDWSTRGEVEVTWLIP